MNKDNVIQFPFGEIRNPLVDPGPAINDVADHEMDLAASCLQDVMLTLIEHGYDVHANEAFFTDMGCILNMIYATLIRRTNPDYPFVEVLDIVHKMIMELKGNTE
tara:strand:+ start:812 stop:1126 length:315 start_codon:yes stop_codon:yes gene_type:complete